MPAPPAPRGRASGRRPRRTATAWTPARWLPLAAAAAALGLSAHAAALPKADHITAWVLALVDGVQWTDAFRPFWQPAPMNAWGFRPLSLALMKAAAALTDGGLPPRWLLAAKAAGGGAAWLLAAVAWLRAHGMSWGAPWVALAGLLLGPHLFSAWYLTELDHLAAAALLAGLAALRVGRGWRGALGATAGIGAALLLKESSALVALSFLAAGAGVAALRRQRAVAARYAGAAALAGLPWLAAAWPLVSGAETEVGRTAWRDRLPLLEHNAVQFGHLATPAGAAAVAAGALGRLPRLPPAAPWALAAVGLAALPLLTAWSHYETLYFAHRWGGAAVAAALLGGLLVVALHGRSSPGQATAAASVLVTLVTVDLAVLASSAPREDLAARLFLAAAPALLGLAAHALREAGRASPAPATRGLVGLVAVAFAWGPLAHFVNGWGEWQARVPVERAGRQALAATPTGSAPVVFNHFLHWVGPEEQAALGAAVSGAAHVPVPAWLNAPRLPGEGYGWTGGGRSLAATRAAGEPVYVLWHAARAQVPDGARAALAGDLSWTRRPLGALASGRVMEPEADVIGAHSWIEDLHRTTWEPGPTPLEALLADQGARLFTADDRYVVLPVNLLDLPRRLAVGAPWAVPMTVEVALWRLEGAP